MLQTIASVTKTVPPKHPVTVSPNQMIDALLGLVRHRRYAHLAYKTPNQQEQLITCDELEFKLLNLRADLSDRTKVSGCLILERSLLSICPIRKESASKLHSKIDDYMIACRAFLGRSKQQ